MQFQAARHAAPGLCPLAAASVTALAFAARCAAAQPAAPPLSEYFGFQGLEIVRIDPDAGPLAVADVDGDGFADLVVVNNHSSRIEVHYQKPGASPDDQESRPAARPNDLPEHWRFSRELVSVSHRVQAVVPHDFDGDGRIDLIYAGSPPELVFLRQVRPRVFQVTRRHQVKDLSTNRNGLAVADVLGDERPELLALVGGQVAIFPLEGDTLGRPRRLAAGKELIAFMVEDYDGDGRRDIAGVVLDDPAPLRLWLAGHESGAAPGAQVRFEMPALVEFTPVRVPGRAAARLAVIEQASKRVVVSDLAREPIEPSGPRDAALQVYSFTDPGGRKRDTAVADVDGDGLVDLVATDTRANALVVYRQAAGKGMLDPESYPCYGDLDYVVAGQVDEDPGAELFVLSEKEGVVGRCDASPAGVPYPVPIPLPEGSTPVSLNLVELDNAPALAIVLKDGRNHRVSVVGIGGPSSIVELGSLSHSPEVILALDADQDGRSDLLLFTRDKPMMMLQAQPEGFALRESKDMGQFGLVKAAQADNTEVFDIDGDGDRELLIADRNFIRAVRYDPAPPAGVSPGWQVVEQINADDPTSRLVSLAVLGDRIAAADKDNRRLVVLGRSAGPAAGAGGGAGGAGPRWREIESVSVKGFAFDSILAGVLHEGGRQDILAIGQDGFAAVRLAGERLSLREAAAWRPDEARQQPHELIVGDVNSDGFVDMMSLDAGEQMCEIFTFSRSERLLHVTGFQVFESKLFSGGESREFEPSHGLVADVTGDGAPDLLLVAHDRVLIYPQ